MELAVLARIRYGNLQARHHSQSSIPYPSLLTCLSVFPLHGESCHLDQPQTLELFSPVTLCVLQGCISWEDGQVLGLSVHAATQAIWSHPTRREVAKVGLMTAYFPHIPTTACCHHQKSPSPSLGATLVCAASLR